MAGATLDPVSNVPVSWRSDWATLVLALVSLGWVCWDARLPGRGLSGGSWGLLLGSFVVLFWLTRVVTAFVMGWWKSRPLRRILVEWRRWCFVPLLIGAGCIAISQDLPARIAFRISRPELDRLARAVAADRMDRAAQWLGLIPISRAQLINTTARLRRFA